MNFSTRMFPVSLAVACLGLTACATTQDFENPGERLDGRIDGLGASVQQVSQQVRQLETSHDARIGKLEGDVRQLSQSHHALSNKVDANHDEFIKSRLEGKLVKQVFLTEDRIMYPANAPEIPAQDAQALDNLAQELKKSETVYHVEIQGHTDDSGNPEFNYTLGEGRAMAVRNYLHQHGGIPLYRMSTVSYGARVPATEATGPAVNRRVKVLIYR